MLLAPKIGSLYLSALVVLRISYVPEHLVVNTQDKAVQDSTCCLLLGQEISMCWLRRYFVRPFYITPIPMPKQVLVHIVFPRCVVIPIDFCPEDVHFVCVEMLCRLQRILLTLML